MAQGASQARSVFQRLDAAAQRHLGISLHYMGGIWRDETLRQSVLNQKPVALLPVSDPSCRPVPYPCGHAGRAAIPVAQAQGRNCSLLAQGVKKENPRTRPKRWASQSPKLRMRPRPLKERCLNAVGEIEAVFSQAPQVDPLLRYEAFTRLLHCSGSTLDSDAIEIIQTGLGSFHWKISALNARGIWPSIFVSWRTRFRPYGNRQPPSRRSRVPREPFYDRISFGEQDRLVRVLKEQPADISPGSASEVSLGQ